MDVFDAIEVSPGLWEPRVKPGLYPDLDNDTYQASAGISKSHTDDIAPERGHTPLHYWDKRVNPDKPPQVERDEWAILGDAIHKAILQPDLMSQFAFVPEGAPAKPTEAMKNSRNPSVSSQDRVSWWSDFEREHTGKRILPVKMHKAIEGARDAVYFHPLAKQFFRDGNSEQSFYAIDKETDALVKCRADYEQLERFGRIVDVKTTDDAAPAAFKRSIRTYRYDVQDAWYTDTIHATFDVPDIVREFIFVAIEKLRPFAINVTWITPEDRRAARDLARRDLRTILECRRTGIWPDFAFFARATHVNRRIEL